MDTQNKIDNYLLGEMNDSERSSFETEMANDKDLREQVELERVLAEGIFAANLREEMKTLSEAHEVKKPKAKIISLNNMKWMAAAASVAILAVFFWQNNSGISVGGFNNVYSLDAGLPVVMGEIEDKKFAEAMIAYKEAEWKQAEQGFNALCTENNAPLSCYFYAQTLIQSEQYATARQTLVALLKTDLDKELSQKAEWHLAYTIYKLDDDSYLSRMQKIASTAGHKFQKAAQEVMDNQ